MHISGVQRIRAGGCAGVQREAQAPSGRARRGARSGTGRARARGLRAPLPGLVPLALLFACASRPPPTLGTAPQRVLELSPALDASRGEFNGAEPANGPKVMASFDGTVFQGGFTIPPNAPPGTATLDFQGARGVRVTRCDGVEQCDFHYLLKRGDAPASMREVVRAFTIEP